MVQSKGKSRKPTAKGPIFEVESLLDRKFKDGQRFYLVKWLNYPSSANTWEPYEGVSHLKDMIKDCERRLEAHKQLQELFKPAKCSNSCGPIREKTQMIPETPTTHENPTNKGLDIIFDDNRTCFAFGEEQAVSTTQSEEELVFFPGPEVNENLPDIRYYHISSFQFFLEAQTINSTENFIIEPFCPAV